METRETINFQLDVSAKNLKLCMSVFACSTGVGVDTGIAAGLIDRPDRRGHSAGLLCPPPLAYMPSHLPLSSRIGFKN